MPKTPISKKRSNHVKTVPYARGYKPPSEKEQLLAIGYKGCDPPREYLDHLEPKEQFFKSIPQPTSIDDWLAQYVEDGQSYSQYIRENPWFSKRQLKFIGQKFVSSGKTICEKYPDGKIYVAKMGDFTPAGVNFDDLVDYVRKFLKMPIEVLDGLDIERKNGELFFVSDPNVAPRGRPGARIRRSFLESREHLTYKHSQIKVDSILPRMQTVIPHDALCLIGLTNYDLYGDDTDLFVAGMAAGMHRVAVFSIFRYNPLLDFSQEFWFDIKESNHVSEAKCRQLMLQRSCKLVVHEICHLLGIAHCTYYSCCMNGSGHLQEDFVQPMMLCPVDLHKLQSLVGFDIEERYKGLLEFYTKHGLDEEAIWTRRRLQFLKPDDKSKELKS